MILLLFIVIGIHIEYLCLCVLVDYVLDRLDLVVEDVAGLL